VKIKKNPEKTRQKNSRKTGQEQLQAIEFSPIPTWQTNVNTLVGQRAKLFLTATFYC